MWLAGILLLATFWFAGCGEDIQPGNTPGKAPITIKTVVDVVKASSHPTPYEVMGTVQPKTAATISAKVIGEIKKITVNEGDHVQKGQLLVSIEDRQIAAGLRQAEAGLREAKQGEQAAQSALKAAKASATLADATYKRYKALLDSESISRQEFDEVEAKYQQAMSGLSQAKFMANAARERVNQAKEGVSAAKAIFSDTTLISPYDGVITARLVDPGDMAAPGAPLLKIEETGDMEVHLLLAESHIQNINIKDTVSVIFPSHQNKHVINGQIVTIDPSADPATRSFLVKITMPEISGLRSGMFARVMIPVGETGMILIPKTAVVSHGQLTAIYLVDRDNIARFHLIRLGRKFGDDVEVVSGLHKDDRYVVNPDHSVVDGVKVEEA